MSMPYEATVPVHRRLLWPAVTDPERLLGALPNVVVDASGAQGVAGRLRVRMREQTVTFRGVARIVEVIPASLRVTLEVEAVFGRAGGTVEGVVEIALRQSGPGTRVVVGGRLEVAQGAAPLPADSLDAALARVVRRWFAALAESSPAGRAERADEQPVPDPPRASERAPLAVVRDMPVDNGAVSAAAAPEPDPEPEPPKNVENAGPEAGAPAPLRLVAPRDDEPDASPPEPEADLAPALGNGASDHGAVENDAPAEPEPEDIWSRLRDRGLPLWIPFLIGVATASLAALAFLLAALRRRQRR
jgi:carbon monoxide dehydrogenase subunit G